MNFKTVFHLAGVTIAGAIMAAGPASADTTSNLKIIGVGVQPGQMYIIFSTPPTGCPNQLVYQPTDATGQYAMSLALSARTSGLPIARVDTHIGSGGNCFLDLLQL